MRNEQIYMNIYISAQFRNMSINVCNKTEISIIDIYIIECV